MDKVRIEIFDDLSPIEELKAIQKQLMKALPKGKKSNKKLIGDQLTIKHLESQITIVRIPREEHNVLLNCFCNTSFEKKLGKRLYVNYGGLVQTKYYCSDNCRDTVLQVCGEGRASIKKRDIKMARFY